MATYQLTRKHGLDVYVVFVAGKIVASFWSEYSANNRCAKLNAKMK